jgi:NADPH-dependent ferric siderophore reductase
MCPPSERATTTASRIDGAVALDLTIGATTSITPWLRELRAEGDLSSFSPWPGQDVMVGVPPGAETQRWRRYTVRRFDPETGSIDFWVTTECEGPGASWARDTVPGDRFEAVGPRGKIALHPDASTHFFVVDGAGLAAMCAMAESLELPAELFTICIVPPTDDAGTSRFQPVLAEDLLPRHHTIEPGDPQWLREVVRRAVERMELFTTAAYVFGELTTCRSVAEWLAELGLDPDRVASKAYWRADRANADRGEPDRDSE